MAEREAEPKNSQVRPRKIYVSRRILLLGLLLFFLSAGMVLVSLSGALGSPAGTARGTFLLLAALGGVSLMMQGVMAWRLRRTMRRRLERASARAATALLERREAEAQLVTARDAAESANRAKTEFVSQISHELKHPLTIASGYVDLLLAEAGGALSAEQRGFVQNIRFSVEQMDRLVSDLGDVSRIESGFLELEHARVGVEALLAEVQEITEQSVRERGVKLAIDAGGGLPAVWGDRTRLQQILLNLVGNGIKYGGTGSILRLAATPSSDGRFVCFAVSDQGPGIPAVDQPYVFEKFYRGRAQRRSEVPGTGLGLSIARHLVLLHGGEIWFESEPGEGTTFYFTVPVAPPAQME